MLGQTYGQAGSCCSPYSLQWRAEQLLDQTARSASRQRSPCRFNGGPSNCSAKRDGSDDLLDIYSGASMEGRAIARPNRGLGDEPEVGIDASMEGRAIARPNRRGICGLICCRGCFNGGPSNCSTKLADFFGEHAHPLGASMEGRAIARPNRSPDLGSLTCPFAGLCERSRKRELRRCLDSVVKLRFALCHKGSSGP